jgi:hypothetical protein
LSLPGGVFEYPQLGQAAIVIGPLSKVAGQLRAGAPAEAVARPFLLA